MSRARNVTLQDPAVDRVWPGHARQTAGAPRPNEAADESEKAEDDDLADDDLDDDDEFDDDEDEEVDEDTEEEPEA